MTLAELEQAITRWGDYNYIGVYALRKDSDFIRQVVNGATKAEIIEHLEYNYPDHFDEEN
jgi:hypothetical protein